MLLLDPIRTNAWPGTCVNCAPCASFEECRSDIFPCSFLTPVTLAHLWKQQHNLCSCRL